MKHVVCYSGGLASWCEAKLVSSKVHKEDITLLFADTLVEDEDLYRFLDDTSKEMGIEVTMIKDGRTPMEVFKDVKFLGNTRADPCSRVLKRDLIDKYIKDNFDVDDTIVHVGLWPDEIHRLERMSPRKLPWQYTSWVCQGEYAMTHAEGVALLNWCGIEMPRLYAMGFPHNNCGGACVKAGQAQWANLLKKMPKRYAEWEKGENEMRELLGDVSILRDRRGGTLKPLPLSVFRDMVKNDSYDQMDLFAGCGCSIDDEDDDG